MQTKEQLETFRNLCKANNLGKVDVWQHKQSGNWIIGRAGIEKIQGLNNIQIGIEVAAAGVDFAVVKATAARTIERKKLKVESLGSANAKNSQVSYYAEMAEKRAKSRSILMLMGFYELGVYGEEEADEFKQSKNVGAPTLDDVEAAPGARPTQPAATPVATEPASTTAAAPAALAESGEPVLVIRASEKELNELNLLIANPLLDADERTLLLSKPVDQRPAEWVARTIAGLKKIYAERQDPKTALEAARKQLRTAAAKYSKEMGEGEYNRLMQRAQALTAKPEELRAEARQCQNQFAVAA
ncbi:hypothetical protein [Hymenobacter metallicola]|uniref:Uncharacterized protein n=1 Tax=Hymenobacter metallicola TaxID=2563114 RepID=A0A4Z0QI79_9BACT|nr:hypothetical protein [Hymenobacter metallicola]TGE29710.1 hypothetical protein E5K02_09705 [Hymenobacter metallicola]